MVHEVVGYSVVDTVVGVAVAGCHSCGLYTVYCSCSRLDFCFIQSKLLLEFYPVLSRHHDNGIETKHGSKRVARFQLTFEQNKRFGKFLT